MVQHQEDALIKRDGLDLHSDVQLPYLKAILGGSIQVTTLEGSAGLNVPEGAALTYLTSLPTVPGRWLGLSKWFILRGMRMHVNRRGGDNFGRQVDRHVSVTHVFHVLCRYAAWAGAQAS